jgi:tartrate dehydrogenase/decarboxylase/D-malate dehydrogenase
MSQTNSVAVIPGDGIGGEVIEAAVEVAMASLGSDEISLDLTWLPWGSEYYKSCGRMMPEDGVDRLRAFDAILFGAVGSPEIPDHVTLWGLRLAICQGLDQYVGYRPAKRLRGIGGPLRSSDHFDFVIVRENTEGEYAGAGGTTHAGLPSEVATQTAVFTRAATERIVDYAFRLARQRNGRLTSVTKSNAQAYGMGLWDTVVAQQALRYPDVSVRNLLVDAAAARLVLVPSEFDVVVASNLFGDILSDIGGALMGSLGMAASANLDPSGRSPSMFEPVHGSAPDIVGRGIANPVGAILSTALMLENLGHEGPAKAIWEATETALMDGARTPELGGDCSTKEVTATVLARLVDRAEPLVAGPIRERESHALGARSSDAYENSRGANLQEEA